ncbi:MAG: hypothetical protein MI784_12775 [Cytophagales bacterium]|nr:hypothetical protein [Cytophagales bacterium]
MQAVRLNFEIEPQEDSRLCWAAVSVAVARFYGEKKISSQIDFAKSVFGKKYNRFCAPEKSLAVMGNFQKRLNRPLGKEEIIAELQNHRPIAACMKFFVGWHLVVVYGIDKRGNLLIADSLFGKSQWHIESFTHAYRQYYHWTHTYKTKKNRS